MLNILFSLSCCYISNLLTLIFAKLSNIISDEKEVPNNHSAVHGMIFFPFLFQILTLLPSLVECQVVLPSGRSCAALCSSLPPVAHLSHQYLFNDSKANFTAQTNVKHMICVLPGTIF